jgi:hypothetical protein
MTVCLNLRPLDRAEFQAVTTVLLECFVQAGAEYHVER